MNLFYYLEQEHDKVYNIVGKSIDNFLYNMIEFVIYTITYFQLFCKNNYYVYIGEFVSDTSKNNTYEYLWINNNGVIVYSDYNELKLYRKEHIQHKMLIICNLNKYVNFIVKPNSIFLTESKSEYYLAPYSNNILKKINMYKVDYTFMDICILYNNSNYSMVLKKEYEYDFYQCGNIIDSNFIKYYLINMLEYPVEDILKDVNFDYILKIIDNKVNFKVLTKKNSIIFYKDMYVIKEEDEKKDEIFKEEPEDINYENIQHMEVF